MYDVFFLTYQEPMADTHWRALRRIVPNARLVSGVPGIHAAHRRCAELATTRMFYVVDADNEVLDFDFRFKPPPYDQGYVHLWYARNPLNGLVYGWGGIKLFPKSLVLGLDSTPLDMTTSFPLKIIPEVASVTHFNTSPFDAWRSAFRETVKLALAEPTEDTIHRLEVWCSTAKGYGAQECLAGANAGRAFAEAHRGDEDAIKKINDFAWLRGLFEKGCQ